MLTKIKTSYKEYPNAFKVLVLSTFIDRFGFFLITILNLVMIEQQKI